MRRVRLLGWTASVIAVGVVGAVVLETRRVAALETTACERVAKLTWPDATITSAEFVAAGAFTPPAAGRRGGGGLGVAVFAAVPAFCRVAATLTPMSDSDIKIEVWLPTANWNGKLQGVGNGGWAGNIVYRGLGEAVIAGYAGVSTDTGHVGGSAQFALGHPEKLNDLVFRSQHEMTVKAKALVKAQYGAGPAVSIWNGARKVAGKGCSSRNVIRTITTRQSPALRRSIG